MKSFVRILAAAAVLALAGGAAAAGAPAPKAGAPEAKAGDKKGKAVAKKGAEDRQGPASFAGQVIDLDENQRTADADRKRDEAIDQLKNIIKNPAVVGPQKAELLFQLAELWIEKSKYIYFGEMGAYDQKYRAYGECVNAKGLENCGAEPKIENRQSEIYRDEALRLYDQILKDYPTYERKDEVLFALATNLYEKGRKEESIARHRDLVTQYPKSKFVGDSYVAMGEHFFNSNDLSRARQAYEKALESSADEPRVYNFALYKLAWCDYNGGEYETALQKFKQVVDRSEASKVKREVALKGEALQDMALTFEKLGMIDEANTYYKQKASKNEARRLFGRLAYRYFDGGGFDPAIKSFRLLINEDANDAKCPEFQSNIVRAYEGLRERDKVLEEMKVLVRNYKPGSAWATANASNKAALSAAYELTEGAMRELVTDYHQEAQKTKEVRTYRLAANIYKEYLDSFSDSDYAYNLRYYYADILWALQQFDLAAEQYELTYLKDPNGSYSTTAALNTMLCYQKLIAIEKGEEEVVQLRDDQKIDEKRAKGDVKKSKKIQTAKIGKDTPEEEIPKFEKKMIEACDRYAAIAGKDKRLEGDEINVRYSAAFIYYDRKHFTEAAKRFGEIILKWPTDAQAQKAADLSLNILETREEWFELARLSRAFYENKKLAKAGDKWTADLAKIMEGAQYKYIDIVVYHGEKNGEKAATMFRDFVKEFPKSVYADQALVYTMVIYNEAKKLDEAISIGEQILREYPDTKHRLRTLFDLGLFYQGTSDFAKAATSFERFVIEWEQQESIRAPEADPKAKGKRPTVALKAAADVVRAKPEDAQKASDALYNAALWNEGLGNFEKAIGLYNEYIAKYHGVKDAVPSATLAFNIALIHEKQKEWSKAAAQYDLYIRDYEKSVTPGKVFYARYKKAMALRQLKQIDEMNKILEVAVKDFARVGEEERKTFTILDAFAHTHFLLLEPKWAAYQKVRLANVRTLKKDLQDKLKLTPAMIESYTDVLKIGSADWGIAALTRIGMINQDFARNFVESPDPPGLDEEQLEMYRSELENRAFPLEEKAIEAYEKALEKSYELNIYNEYTLAAQDALNKFKPGEYGELRPVSYTGSEFFSRAKPALGVAAVVPPAGDAKPKVEGQPAPADGKAEVKEEEVQKKGVLIMNKSAEKQE
jgi:tetratricopeptide (TPR) repeat protein